MSAFGSKQSLHSPEEDQFKRWEGEGERRVAFKTFTKTLILLNIPGLRQQHNTCPQNGREKKEQMRVVTNVLQGHKWSCEAPGLLSADKPIKPLFCGSGKKRGGRKQKNRKKKNKYSILTETVPPAPAAAAAAPGAVANMAEHIKGGAPSPSSCSGRLQQSASGPSAGADGWGG